MSVASSPENTRYQDRSGSHPADMTYPICRDSQKFPKMKVGMEALPISVVPRHWYRT